MRHLPIYRMEMITVLMNGALPCGLHFLFNPYFGGGYYLVDIYQPSSRSTEWIELWIYVNPVTGYVDA